MTSSEIKYVLCPVCHREYNEYYYNQLHKQMHDKYISLINKEFPNNKVFIVHPYNILTVVNQLNTGLPIRRYNK